MNSQLAMRFYFWLCKREITAWHRKGLHTEYVEIQETFDTSHGKERVVYHDEQDPPPNVYTRLKDLMYWFGFIPF